MGYQIAQAGQAPKYFKIIATGTAGAGKTRFGMDGGTFEITKDGGLKGHGELWPDLLIVNAEGGVSAYEEPFEGMFRVVHTNKITELSALVDDIYTGKVKCGTLQIDTWTTFQQLVREAVESQTKGDMSFKEWGKINRAMPNIQNKLAMLPCHVILVVHESDVIETGKGETARQGISNQDGKVKLAANKTVAQWADIILWFQPRIGKNTRVRVHKARGVFLGEDGNLMLENPSWQKTFKPIAERWANRGGDTIKLDETDGKTDAVQAVADDEDKPTIKQGKTIPSPVQTFANHDATKRWVPKWLRNPYNLTHEQIFGVLGVTGYGDEAIKDMTFAQADELINAAFAAPINEG